MAFQYMLRFQNGNVAADRLKLGVDKEHIIEFLNLILKNTKDKRPFPLPLPAISDRLQDISEEIKRLKEPLDVEAMEKLKTQLDSIQLDLLGIKYSVEADRLKILGVNKDTIKFLSRLPKDTKGKRHSPRPLPAILDRLQDMSEKIGRLKEPVDVEVTEKLKTQLDSLGIKYDVIGKFQTRTL
ncbi:MAG: hypothetical protein AAB037_03205 [Chloroflexota bacterium]